ncbi:5-methyltetrahydropteroyltriglutamate--homocysteine S-methyltransferase [uncultured Lactobacillus sp.]|uniref:5-methyltetrahydropteroyltriglutamate-- homocysteine S-methyltransferase n=1 Tax=uncultured Lactobacillus sp. TaxID=153152 RepID=UPI002805ABBB|nr:5-methyltetrahydropteroyltriglutamate--homocysteine S-methyltransferase [uncultured Lactobacillus sp.]
MSKTLVHYDIVGSFLRPENLKKARADFAANKISAADLKKVEDEEIAKLVKKEEEAGLKIVTDGEFRRSYWHLDTFWGFGGIEHVQAEHGYQFNGEETRKDAAKVVGKITYQPGHPDVKAFDYLKQLTADSDVIPRQSIPSPAQFYCELICRNDELIAATDRIYPDHNDLAHDVSQAYHDLILDLYNHGARDIKLDDCTWGVLADDKFWPAFSEKGRLQRDEISSLYQKINEDALVDLPADLRISTHICRGNYDSHWAAQGGYAPVAKYVFKEKGVDAFYLEFDDERSGNFEPIKEVAPDKEVVLGLVTTKKPELEKAEDLIARIKEASAYHDLDNLSLSTQCGFASTEEGNHLTEDDEWKKIALVIDTAKQVWK